MTATGSTAPLSDEELEDFLRDPGDAWENTQRKTDDWLGSIAATITGLWAERDGLRVQVTRQKDVLDACGETHGALRKKHEAAEAELTALRTQLRTPGTVEACQKCGVPYEYENGDPGAKARCDFINPETGRDIVDGELATCPLRAQPEREG